MPDPDQLPAPDRETSDDFLYLAGHTPLDQYLDFLEA